ncbi:MAG: circularly permuted type 2 ATP-grasp protein, partial [Acidimicrobiales bacterium]|nr:circularly permuted type 2 ATP-grasp protein [Acidimicrobiales bacterium]
MTSTPTRDTPLGRYVRARARADGVGDELVGVDGALRPHWVELIAGYDALGPVELDRRASEIRLLLEQDGVTYNAVGLHGRHRPWTLDAVPLVIDGTEWRSVEQGVAQRMELLELILRDLYGERRLLRSGLVPPEMVLGDPQFERACHGIVTPGPRQLVVGAVDLVRHTGGDWVAFSHRSEAPSGAAFALENRRVLSRVFPLLFQRTGVQRLAPFVRALRSALRSAAPPGVDDPSIVILTPGPLSETAFEHASIAAQLGYPLVQGADLEIRDGLLWLRTVARPVRVDVVLRRVDSWFSDPLELHPDSTLGVAGLVDACRAQRVSVVNPLGAGVLENAGLVALLPDLARALLGEELALPSAPSWWCGDDVGRSHVVANLPDLVLRPLSRRSATHSVDTRTASAAELDELRRRIEAHPCEWVGQERLDPATAPVLAPAGLVPRPTVLRAFAVAGADGYNVMAGGLARAATDGSSGAITNRAGALAKDVWVVATEPEPEADFWLMPPE